MSIFNDIHSIVGSVATSKRIKVELQEAALATAQAEVEWTRQERQKEIQERVEKKRKKERKKERKIKILKKLKKAYYNAPDDDDEEEERAYRAAYLAYHGYEYDIDEEYY